MERGLTEKERAFVEAYVCCLNAAEAVRRAGYSTPHAAGQSRLGSEILRRKPVKEAIESWKRKRSAESEITVKRLLDELEPIAFLDPREVLNEDWSPLPPTAMGERARAIKKVRVRMVPQRGKDPGPPEIHTEVEFHDKLGAIDKLARILGAYAEDREKERQTDHLADIRERLRIAQQRASTAMPISRAEQAAEAAEDAVLMPVAQIEDDAVEVMP